VYVSIGGNSNYYGAGYELFAPLCFRTMEDAS
jgi:hypothetical protein